MRLPARSVVALTAAIVMLMGCAPQQPGRQAGQPAEPTQNGASPPSQQPSPNLAAQKKAAGIADCPVADATVPAVVGGLPDVVLNCLGGGRPVRLAGLRGRPMMINIWAQWCPPCREEAPFISEVALLNKSDLMILGVDYADPRPEWAIEFAQLSSWKYPQLVDRDKALMAPLQIVGPPQTYFVAADGAIAYRHSGPFSSADQIRELARKHLGVSL